MPYDIKEPVYPVGDHMVSMHDLLMRFGEDEHRLGKIWRLSDLHLKAGEVARYRFDNDLVALEGAARLTPEVLRRLLFPLLRESQIKALSADPPVDVDAGFELPGDRLNFRINAFHDREGLAASIRVLPATVPDLDEVGFPSEDTWREIAAMRQGLVIVTGITGSGKSTTVASILQHINRNRSLRVITLEDPVEYTLASDRSLISQRELGGHVRSFHDGLRSALREDPDILFVGEMRDHATTSLALSAAETGHLVFSTLHTKDARGAITRIVDMYPAERSHEVTGQLSFSLSFVLAQKLVPRRAAKGRRVVMEVLKNIPPVANLIRTGKWHQIYSTMEAHRRSGLITLEHHLAELVAAGEIDRETALRYANEPTMVR